MKIGDVVLVKNDNENRNEWKMDLVTDIHPINDGKVRSVTIHQNHVTYKHPVNKLLVLVKNDWTSNSAMREPVNKK